MKNIPENNKNNDFINIENSQNSSSSKLSVTEPEVHSAKKRVPLLAIITSATVLVLAFITFLFFKFFAINETYGKAENSIDKEKSEYAFSPSASADEEMRGVWIASVFNINFPSKQNLSVSEMKNELDEIVKTVSEANLNAIFFQAIPSSDALYKSNVYPWSSFLTGTQGKAPDDGFDPLAYIIEKAHAAGIELHAWINPYRVTHTAGIELTDLAENHPARLHPEYCVKYTDGKYYYNPGVPEVRSMLSSEAAFIASNYDVDGIHMDDYFYPYPVAGGIFDDADEYALYGSDMSLEDWRRENVNMTVKSIYEAVKAVNPDCRFGISPFGIYANKGSGTPVTGSDTQGLEAYNSLYCDALAWVKGGYVDYLAPQIYWAFSTSVAPFDIIARWWNANLDGTGVDLYIGHALHKIEEFPENEIPIQAEFARNLMCYKGSIFYGYAYLESNTCGIKDKLKEMYSALSVTESDTQTRLTAINYPQNGYKTAQSSQYMLGSSDPSSPITLNGDPVSRTKSGYFSFYTNLASGDNSYILQQGANSVSHSVTYSTTVAAVENTLPSYDITNMSPSSETWISGGDTVYFSCTAPAGSTVTATVGGASVQLSPTLGAKTQNGTFIKEVYSGSIKFGSLAAPGEIIDLGTITFTASSGSYSKTVRTGLMRQIGEGALIYAQVNRDYTYLKKSPTSSFYDDYTPTSPGMRDYITGFKDGYYKLRFGGYVSSDSVTVVEGQPLYSNAVLSAESEVVKSDNQIYDENYTELRFEVLENVPIDVWVNGAEVTIVIYDTLPETMPQMNLVDNPLFESVTPSAGASGKTVLYTAMLKDEKNYYGFKLEYDSSFIKIKFNNPIGLSQNPEKPLEGKVIYVDAGHGGTDIGARGPGEPELKMFESNLNLLIANSFAEKLAALGAKVYTTRTEDVTYDLYERLDMISAVVPDILVSVHHNSVADSTNASRARGYLGLYSNNSGIMLAETISDTVCSSLNRYQRATAYQKLAVARDHRFPSTLCEMSFISNVEEFQWTLSEGNIERSAQALCDGVVNFFEKQEAYK